MNCIIIEDQSPAQRILKKYIEDTKGLELKATFSNAIDAIDFFKNNTTDLIFLDIHLPKLSGIAFLKTLKNTPQVILTTAFTDYAIEGYELNVIDYLLKPFSFQRFTQAVNKAQKNTTKTSKEIYIKSGYELIKIKLEDVLFIKSDTDYTEFNVGDKTHLSTEPLRYWETELKEYSFKRIHKSYIVNTAQISKIGTNYVVLLQNDHIPIGRVYKDNFINSLH